jgi:hypothetical protein
MVYTEINIYKFTEDCERDVLLSQREANNIGEKTNKGWKMHFNHS